MKKVTFISDMTTREALMSNEPKFNEFDLKLFTLHECTNDILNKASDTEYLVVDAMAKIENCLIDGMPNLKLIHSEGVGYQGVDVDFAKSKNIIVCNNKGINSTAVAEATVMHILACLKDLNLGRKAMFDGKQINFKAKSFGAIRELGECTVGLVGFGDIARQTARLLKPFGCKILYSNRTRYEELEDELGVEYVSIEELLRISDFVSLHLAVVEDTIKYANEKFFNQMKDDAYLINTSRGALVDNNALYNALKNGQIAGAGLDVIDPEPVEKNNIILSADIADKLILTPHIAGITSLTVKKLYKNIYNNILCHINGEKLKNVVG